MPDDTGRTLVDGRLNLEQQKKRAKELLRDLRAGDSAAADRLRAHPKSGRLAAEAVQLADAQLIVARENGFATWPRLKEHADALAAARAAAKRPDLAPDTPNTVHIRCGTDIQRSLTRAGFTGRFQLFANPFCQGPVRDLPLADFIAERAAFIAKAYSIYPDQALKRLEGEYAALEALGGADRIALWFEHDSYDQLVLAYLLTRLGGPGAPPLVLICADRAPAVSDFIGLGQLAPEVIRVLWAGRVEVNEAHCSLARAVWAALTAPTPEPLFRIGEAGTPAIPPMAGALARHLQELPSVANGLGLTEHLALDLLNQEGPMTAARLFARLHGGAEPRPFLGDAMFWPILRDLAGGDSPLIDARPAGHHDAWPERRVAITLHGQAVRASAADRLADRPPPRWVGGVLIDSAKPCWRWDESAGRPRLMAEVRA
ncbi:MAG: DUF1835 domain-containing protein [Caulobacterales bacterium]